MKVTKSWKETIYTNRYVLVGSGAENSKNNTMNKNIMINGNNTKIHDTVEAPF
jgi:hypothetical protein